MNVFLFPGQGSQYCGMYRSLNLYSSEIKDLFDCAYDVTGVDVRGLCQNASDSVLKQTQNTQLSVLLMSLAYYKILSNRNICPDVVMGHSLGQFSALAACGAISIEDTIRLVQQRANLMSQVNKDGCLASVIGLTAEQVQSVCDEYAGQGVLSIALLNTPKQIVVGGDKNLVELSVERFKALGAIKTVFLSVSAAFHTLHMKDIENEIKGLVNKCEISKPHCDIILNCSAERTSDVDKIREDIIAQCCNTVRWSEGLEQILSYESSLMCEVGVGKVLAGMVRSIDKSKTVYSAENAKQLQMLLQLSQKKQEG